MNNQENPQVNEDLDPTQKVTELSEDIEVVSPGSMLREARQELKLSQQYIAQTLNFTMSLVKAIEEDRFDPKMPVTFNRGYLVNYAKLVSIEVEDVLASYEVLHAASIQRSEMLSFSKETSKQAEHSRVMWISYLVIAVLIGLTILWWAQQSNEQTEIEVTQTFQANEVLLTQVSKIAADTPKSMYTGNLLTADSALDINEPNNKGNQYLNSKIAEPSQAQNTVQTPGDEKSSITKVSDVKLQDKFALTPDVLSKAVFTFNGDCWVNIYDAANNRIAWGIKKAGYVMTIQGVAPFEVTVGKPELTSITFNDQPVDMSSYTSGNIAKFQLPVETITN